MMGDWRYALGFTRPCPSWPFGNAESFGAPGSGGSFAYADPRTGVGYAYVTSQSGTSLNGDPRDLALRHALESALSRAG